MKKIFLIVPVTKIMVMVLFAFVLLLPLSARAQVKGGSFEVSPFVGYNFFESGQNVKNNFVYGGRLGYNFTKYFGIEATGEYIHSRVDDRSITTVKEGRFTGPSDNVDIGFYHLDAIVHFMPDSRFTPFIVAGVGGAHYYPKISDKDMFTIDVGVGAKFWLTEHIALRVDVRDNMATEVFQETYHNISATAGIVFAFGGRKSAPAPALAMKSEPEPEAKSETIIVERRRRSLSLRRSPRLRRRSLSLRRSPRRRSSSLRLRTCISISISQP
jgi:OOP family OmpA-OmpF porin